MEMEATVTNKYSVIQHNKWGTSLPGILLIRKRQYCSREYITRIIKHKNVFCWHILLAINFTQFYASNIIKINIRFTQQLCIKWQNFDGILFSFKINISKPFKMFAHLCWHNYILCWFAISSFKSTVHFL